MKFFWGGGGIAWDRSHLHRIHARYIVQPVAKINTCTWNTVPHLGFDSLSPGDPPLMSKLLQFYTMKQPKMEEQL